LSITITVALYATVSVVFVMVGLGDLGDVVFVTAALWLLLHLLCWGILADLLIVFA